MLFAFADLPYRDQAKRLYGRDEIDQGALIARLVTDYPDGWALCMGTRYLRVLLPLCPETVRVGAWVKPFANFKPNVNPGYAWEPVVFSGGRKMGRNRPTVRDYVSCSIAIRTGLKGAKPLGFVRWILEMLGFENGDQIEDLFPGTNIMGMVARQLSCRGLQPNGDSDHDNR